MRPLQSTNANKNKRIFLALAKVKSRFIMYLLLKFYQHLLKKLDAGELTANRQIDKYVNRHEESCDILGLHYDKMNKNFELEDSGKFFILKLGFV